VKKNLFNSRFVVDKSDKNTVLGIVSNTYSEYSNYNLINLLELNFLKYLKMFTINESYVINTRLYLRLLSDDIKVGSITGYGGNGDDISKVGLQIRNSMVGDSSVNISYFIKRLICANGLIVETSNSSTRVFHRGKPKSFDIRLNEAISGTYEGIDSVVKMLITLSEIPYNPNKLVDSGGVDLVYNIIPLKKNEIKEKKHFNKEEQLDFDKKIISSYPDKYSGSFSKKVFNSPHRDNATMFDFVNIFTEYAHNKDIKTERRIDIEKNTGDFVRWVIENKEKLL
jgi:hypothetical protein